MSHTTAPRHNEKATVFSHGKQVEHTRLNFREVSINVNGKDIETTDLMIEDILSGVFYALTAYKDQLAQVETEKDANTDTYFVLDALLSHAKDQMENIIGAFEQHLGGRVYFLETLRRKAGDYAGIMVQKIENDEARNNVESILEEKEISK